MKNFVFFLSVVLLLSCKENAKQATPLPEDSIFNLSTYWKNQNGDSVMLNNLQGKTLAVVMVYTSCKTACPILVSKMKRIESGISRKDIEKVSFVLVSIDPETDTPEHLKAFAKTNNMDAPQWVFLTSNEANTREFANVLSMKYKKISPMDFSHSNIISVFNPSGQLVSQEEGEINVDQIVSTMNQTLKAAL